MKYKAIIFDLDGTLLDTIEDIAISTNRVLNKYGFKEHTISQYRYLVGDGSKKLMANASGLDINNPKIELLDNAFKQDYAHQYKISTNVYTGVKKLLKNLHESFVKIAVLSNKPHKFVEFCVKEYFEDIIFDAVFGVIKEEEKKPSPVGVFNISNLINVDPKDILFVGDTKTDMLTAFNAKVDSCGVLWGFRDEVELRENHAKFIVSKPDEILSIVGVL